ncbi:DUF2614 family zinc ribbon-containing protein [Sphingobium sp.]|uniref:DUF2614 family zinc ribbon-containing protein n=1 Tax=Sphingobium sp. TaxID=1912891 RepID=UPI003BB67360
MPASFSMIDPAPCASAALLTYRPGKPISCPDCGQSQWLVGRVMAQCACCETALTIDTSHRGWSGLTPVGRALPWKRALVA